MEISTTAPIQPQNGAAKRRLPETEAVVYKECMKNHAASRGGHALDGCCEFMASLPESLACAACGCHRNFHRRETQASQFTEYLPHHRHLPLPPPIYGSRSPNSHSPPPISSSAPPHALFSLTSPPHLHPHTAPFGRKRIRTKFSQEQKEKMLGFAEKIGWKMQRGIEETVSKFCSEIGVERGVFKVWMHNHKNPNNNNNNNSLSSSSFKRDLNLEFGNNGDKIGVSVNGCSSSS